MATSQSVTSDSLATYHRLFCHRPALQGEFKYLVREMEGKRNDREIIRLKEAQAKVERIDRALPECEELAAKRFQTLQKAIDAATDNASAILSEKIEEDKIRQSMKAKRDQEWDAFEKEMNKARKDVEKIHHERMVKLEKELKSQEIET